MRHQSTRLHRQRGFAIILLVWVLLGTLAVLIAFAAAKARQTYAGEQLVGGSIPQHLDIAAERLEAFYQGHAADMDRKADAPWTPQALLLLAGMPPEWRIQAIIGARQMSPPVAWRSIYIWIPPRNAQDTTKYDADTDTFTPAPNVSWRTISGYRLQYQRVQETYATMQKVGVAAVNRFAILRNLDHTHDPQTNWFQVDVNKDGYLTLDALGYTQALGLSPAMTKDAWGANLTASNTLDTNSTSPYNMILRAFTPWGDLLKITATQP